MEASLEKLRSRRLAVTPQRLAVLAVLDNLMDHPTAERIYQEVRRQIPAISFNTEKGCSEVNEVSNPSANGASVISAPAISPA